MNCSEKRIVTPMNDWQRFLEEGKKEFDRLFTIKNACTCDKDKFIILQTIGKGAFGCVYLSKMVDKEDYYAIKVLDKRLLKKKKRIDKAINEKRILQALNFPFCIQLSYSYQDYSYVYFCLPLVNGGELWKYMRTVGRLDEPVARFYGAQVLLALEYLHYCDLIFRDLKPENILIDVKGFIKLVDFGFCKLVKTRTYSMCGTAEYLAPEICLQKGYSKSVDWWSYGVLLYEMNAGYLPFTSKDPMSLYKKIVDGEYQIPNFFSSHLKDLIQNLLQEDLTRRYGNLKGGAGDIKRHTWYSMVNWLSLVNGNQRPPYVPIVTGCGDTSQFDPLPEVKLNVSPKGKAHDGFEDF